MGLCGRDIELSRLGFELWPELRIAANLDGISLADWDLSSGRNTGEAIEFTAESLADWDLSSGRNSFRSASAAGCSLADWDLSSGRNQNMLLLGTERA